MKHATLVLLGILALTVRPLAAQEDNRTLLAVFAHADDDFFVMPLLARYAREGADVRVVVAANRGTYAPMTDLTDEDAVTAHRAEEARCSATALGLHPPTIFDLPDGGLGAAVVPPWATLRQLEDSLRAVFAELAQTWS